ncbi:MAG: GNAT family N-acetyltransferase [Desulfopila sp.]
MAIATTHIRPATQQDIDEMILLLKDLFTIEADFQYNPANQAAALELLLVSDQGLVLVAEQDEEVVGMCSGQIVISTAEGGPALLVEDVVVRQGARGQGVGGKLLRTLASWAASRNIVRMQLLVDRANEPALAFYRKAGWQSTQMICLRSHAGT